MDGFIPPAAIAELWPATLEWPVSGFRPGDWNDSNERKADVQPANLYFRYGACENEPAMRRLNGKELCASDLQRTKLYRRELSIVPVP